MEKDAEFPQSRQKICSEIRQSRAEPNLNPDWEQDGRFFQA